MLQKNSVSKIDVVVGCLYRENTQQDLFMQQSNYEFLLQKRYDEYISELDEIWELPGGKVNQYESDEEAVVREFLEETGYHVKPQKRLGRNFAYTRKYPGKTLHVIVSCFICTLVSPRKEPVKEDKKVGNSVWMNPVDIDFKSTLQGSREFIVDTANELNIELINEFDRTTFYAKFRVPENSEHPKAKTRLGREYSVSIIFNLKGVQPSLEENQYYLVTNRSGKTHYVHKPLSEDCKDYVELISRVKKRIRDRHYHGYQLEYCDNDFPLIEWMEDRNFPKTDESQSSRIITFQPPLLNY